MEFKIHDVVTLLITEKDVVKKWKELFDSLGLTGNSGSLQIGKRNGTLTDYQLFTEILVQWQNKMGGAATLDQLCLKLREINCLNACDKVQDAFQAKVTFGVGFTSGESIFVGRFKELDQLDKMLREWKQEESTIAKIIGMGGIGKSELAKKFSRLHKNEMNQIWLDGESEESLKNSLLRLAKHIFKTETESENLSSPELFRHIIETISKSNTSPILTIIDNFDIVNEDAKALVKMSKKFRIFCIITSRHVKVLGVAGQTINLNVLEDLQNYEHRKSKMLTFPLDDLEDEYKETTFMIWNTSIHAVGAVEGVGAVALKLLDMMAYLEADGIPFNFIQKLYQQDSKDVTKKVVKKGIELLKAYSLIKVKNHDISIHRLVQEVMRLNCASSKTQDLLLTRMIQGIQAINQMLKQEDIPHVLSVWKHVSKNDQFTTTQFNSFRM